MAKLVKMLNIQNLIILFVLLATTLVNSVPPRRLPPQGVQITDLDIDLFYYHLEHQRRITAGLVIGINHFNSLEWWSFIPRDLREHCVIQYRNDLNAQHLNEQSDPGDLARLAYIALDTVISEAYAKDMQLLDNRPELREYMEIIQREGEYLKFASYLLDNSRKDNM